MKLAKQRTITKNKFEIESNHKAIAGVLENKQLFKDMMYKIPNFSLKSSIVQFKTWTAIWKHLPSYVQIRKPDKIFETAEDGYNIETMYQKARNFLSDHDERGAEI